MGKIKVMSQNLANKIAAGEVVERIGNVVKELVENSIDAGSTSIKIELIEAGTRSIKVIDNGVGMSADDALLCFERHATSKIKTDNDLYFINTLGFRGEALAAISSVSNVILDTYDGKESTKVNIKAGKIEEKTIGQMNKGTSIEVKELFYNTPARLKFLKSLNTELSVTSGYIEKIALSHPEIAFHLINDGKDVVKTTGSNNLFKTIHEIFGYQVSKNIIEIKAENYDYVLTGFISNLNIQKSNRNNTITLVNGRVVTNVNLNRAIKDAYHAMLAENKYPLVVLNIETDPTLVDVNIHPTKQDIKFSKLESLEDLVFSTIRSSLNNTDQMVKGYEEEEKQIFEKYDYKVEEKEEPKEEKRIIEEIKLNFDINDNVVEYNKETHEKEDFLIEPVGLALGTYLIAQSENMMYMIDIHAANERINYEKYMDELENKTVYKTNMLFPLTLEYSHAEYMNIKENIEAIKDLGFDVEEFGTNTFRVSAHPTWLKEGYEDESIKRIFELMGEFKDRFDRVTFNEKAAIRLSCKMAVKANTNITYEEQEELLKKLFKCRFPYTCPHGRPTIIKYPLYELEKIFKRVN